MRIFKFLCDAKKVGKLTKFHSNLPDSYIERSMEQVQWRTPRGYPFYLRKEVKKKQFHFGAHRPWSFEFKMDNRFGSRKPKVFIEPVKEWNIFLGDRVEILVGEDKGKQGFVCQIFEERNWVLVEGLNMKLKAIDVDGPVMYMKEEQPLVINRDVVLVDPSDLKGCKTEWRFTEEGEKVRVSTRSGRIIPIPVRAEETIDYKSSKIYIEGDKDTKDDEIVKITYQPKLKTFEMDIMDDMEIKEERVAAPVYWY